MADGYHKVVAVISQPPEMRTERDVTILSSWFRKKSDLFRDLADAILHDLVRHCRFQRFLENDVIIRQGDQGDSFFTVLSGSVGIYVANDDDGEGSNHLDDDSPRDGGSANMIAFGAYIRSLGSGKSFGEVALIDSTNRRGASVLAEEASDMIVVDRNLYTRSLKAAQKRDLEERIAFVEGHPLFGKWKPKYKNYMAMGISRRIYRYGNHITRQDDVIKKVNFLLSGTALVTVDRTMKSGAEHAQLESQSADVKASRRRRREAKSARVDSMVEICLIGQQAIIGDIEAVCGLSKHTHTITCIEPVHTYEMEMRSFHKLVMRRHPQTVEKLRAMVVFKIQNRWERLRDKKVPIYRTILEKLLLHEFRHDDGAMLPGVQTNSSMLSSGITINARGPGSLYRKLREARERHVLLSRRQSLFPRFGADAQLGDASRVSTRRNNRSHPAKDASRDKRDQPVKQGKLKNASAPSVRGGHNHLEERDAEDVVKRNSKNIGGDKDVKERSSPTKIKWILPDETQQVDNSEEPPASNQTDADAASRPGSSSQTVSPGTSRKKGANVLFGDERVSVAEDSRGTSGVKLPTLRDKREARHQRNVFVTERLPIEKRSTASSQTLEQRLDQGTHEDLIVSRTSQSDVNDHAEVNANHDRFPDSEYDNDDFEEESDNGDNNSDCDVTSECETIQTTNDGRGPSTRRKRRTVTRMSSQSAALLDQEELLQLAYETYVSVSSEVKKFLVKVIADAKRYEGSQPAGLESRLRPINSKLPRFLDERRDGIGREATSTATTTTTMLGRGHEGVGHSSLSQHQSAKQRPKQQQDATSKTTRGRGRERSKSEGDTEQLISSGEIVTSNKLPSLHHHQPTPPKTFYQISKDEQNEREAAPSALDLIYRQFGAVKKIKPRRQYTEREYKELKDMLRAQQKRYIRYPINL